MIVNNPELDILNRGFLGASFAAVTALAEVHVCFALGDVASSLLVGRRVALLIHPMPSPVA